MATTYGVTDDGYVLKPQSVINEETEQALLNVVDPVTGDSLQVDFDSSDIVAQTTLVTLEGVGDGLQENQVCFNQFDPAKATGAALSGLVQLNGILRKDATASTVTLHFTGTPSLTINDIIQVTDQNNENIWQTDGPFTFDVTGDNDDVPATCLTPGAITALTGTLTIIVTPVIGVDSVTNDVDAIVGQNEETDSELRQRRDNSTEAPSIGLPASIRAVLLNVQNVTFARVYNNVTLVTDPDGVNPKSLAAVVVGGDNTEIAQVLFSRASTGTNFQGNTSETFIDIQGNSYVISFFRPTEIEINVDLNIELVEDDIFPVTGVDDIKDAIVAYSTGGAPALGITDGFDEVGFNPGTDIFISRLYTPINSVPGHRITSLELGTVSIPLAPNDIPIAFNEVGKFLTTNITVTVS